MVIASMTVPRMTMAHLHPAASISFAHSGLHTAPPMPENAMAIPVAVPAFCGNHLVSSMGTATLPTQEATPQTTAEAYHSSPSARRVIIRKLRIMANWFTSRNLALLLRKKNVVTVAADNAVVTLFKVL